jgi:hypothetical protein
LAPTSPGMAECRAPAPRTPTVTGYPRRRSAICRAARASSVSRRAIPARPGRSATRRPTSARPTAGRGPPVPSASRAATPLASANRPIHRTAAGVAERAPAGRPAPTARASRPDATAGLRVGRDRAAAPEGARLRRATHKTAARALSSVGFRPIRRRHASSGPAGSCAAPASPTAMGTCRTVARRT